MNVCLGFISYWAALQKERKSFLEFQGGGGRVREGEFTKCFKNKVINSYDWGVLNALNWHKTL